MRACHLISRLHGNGKYTILLVAHVDTVFKKGEVARRPFHVDENNFAWGPGVGDDKATVVEVIHGLQALKATGFDNYKEIIYYTNGRRRGRFSYCGSHCSRTQPTSRFCYYYGCGTS